MARQMTDDWQGVEEAFVELDALGASRSVLAAMRSLVAAIRADSRFHNLEPSVSHEHLVFRRGAKRGVIAFWNKDESDYRIAFLEPGFTFRDPRQATRETVLNVLLEYLAQAPP
jgi:hypothetical protein